MLKIVNPAGRVLWLSSDQVINVERNNSLFGDPNNFLQDVSYSFTIPFSASSDLFFHFGRLVEVTIDRNTINDVSCFAPGVQLIKGNITYTISENGYEANLEPNFAAINNLIKNIRITEIRTEDAEYGFNQATFEARMLDSAINPDKYPYIFFPVRNPGFAGPDVVPPNRSDYVNFYDETVQKFRTDFTASAQTPFFKLGYIIKQIANYLGLTATGSYFTDPETKNRCVYTRYAFAGWEILPCMTYMPNMLVSDFLKQITQREHMAMDFDLLTGELRVETFKSIKNSAKVVDLTGYISVDGDQEMPDAQGLTVTLKSDEQDANFAWTDVDGNVTYPPSSTLIAGTGETVVELDCGTTKNLQWSTGAIEPSVDQTVIYDLVDRPDDINYTDPNDVTTLNNWPLRLINYQGYLPVIGGYYPCATSHDLSDVDKDWYRFINDSKRIKPIYYLPAGILAPLRVTDRFTHKFAGGNYVTYISEQLAWGAGADAKRIPLKNTARIIDYQESTLVEIIPLPPQPSTVEPYFYNMGRMKAYFDPKIHGIKSVKALFVGNAGDDYLADEITLPTNPKGTGGAAVTIYSTTTPADADPVELRIYQGQPKYMLHRGLRQAFVKVADYYTVTLDLWGEQAHIPDTYTIFF